MNIQLIRDKSKLQGTCFFEFLPGPYKGQCWTESSIFLEEEIFGLVEPIFERQIIKFDHYASTEVSRTIWTAIIIELQSLKLSLVCANGMDESRPPLGLLRRTTSESFSAQFSQHAQSLRQMIDELIAWIKSSLFDHDVISVLGL